MRPASDDSKAGAFAQGRVTAVVNREQNRCRHLAEDGAGCDAVAQLQRQIDALQAQLFQLAVARQMAITPEVHYVNTSTLPDITAFKAKQVVRFNEVYKRLPYRLAECLVNNVQQHVTRFIYSQPWEIENLESLRWMLAVESVV